MTRIDKWLWAARFFKTRSLAQKAIELGRVRLREERVKTSRELQVGDRLTLDQGDWEREVEVCALAEIRGSAVIAQSLYRDSERSINAKDVAIAKARERRLLFPEPAHSIRGGRPSKQDRRAIARISR